MPVQMRLNASDTRLYNPDRDLAYCSPHLVHRAMLGLDPTNQEEWVLQYINKNKLNEDVLVQSAKVLASYMNEAMLDPKYSHPFQALKSVGFFDLPKEAQVLVCAKIGQVFLSAIFSSIRDVTRNPTEPPINARKMADIAEDFQKQLHTYRSLSLIGKWCFNILQSLFNFFGLFRRC